MYHHHAGSDAGCEHSERCVGCGHGNGQPVVFEQLFGFRLSARCVLFRILGGVPDSCTGADPEAQNAYTVCMRCDHQPADLCDGRLRHS